MFIPDGIVVLYDMQEKMYKAYEVSRTAGRKLLVSSDTLDGIFDNLKFTDVVIPKEIMIGVSG